VAGLDGRFLEVNRALCQLLGYSKQQLLLTTAMAITHPHDVEDYLTGTRELLTGDTTRFQFEQRYSHADGHVGWALVSVSLLRDSRRNPLHYVLGFDDISASHRDERLRAVTFAVARRLGEASDESGVYRSVLQGLCEDLGWDIGQLWVLNADSHILALRESWHASSTQADDAEEPGPVPGIDVAARILAESAPLWIVDITQDSNLALSATAVGPGLHGAVGFPILNAAEASGVVNFYSREPLPRDKRLLTIVGDIGSQVGQFIERKRVEAALQESAELIRGVLDNVADGIVTIDEGGLIEFFNRAALRLFGYPLAEVLGQKAKILMAEPYRDDFVSHLSNYLRPGKGAMSISGSRELWGQRKDGSTFPMEFRASEMLVGGERRFVGILHDISEQRAQKDALEYQTLHDALTGLPNRTLFNDRLRQGIAIAQRERKPLVLLIMDMDRFKEVNDTLGHHIGDLLLQQVALRLVATLRQSDTVARLGGDEFAVLPAAGTDLHGASQAAQKILHALEQPFVVDGRNIDVGASIGLALFPEHGEEADTMMRHADVAMYVAKRTKRGSVVYTPQHDEKTAAHLALIGELRHAIGHDELVLHYQPTVALGSGKTMGVEALVRWRHPKQGLMPPEKFVPAAEETELVQPLARWVLNQGLGQLRRWLDGGLQIDLSVNLSAWNLHDPDFPDVTSDLLDRYQVEPDRLKLEITESSIMAHSAIETVTRLSGLGVGLSIDDFGTGYSSLSYLKRLPVTEIKIDKSFIIGMIEDSASTSIVRPIIELGHNMGLQVVAEGVENKETWDMLRTWGCDLAQGNYMCPPIPTADLTVWLRESSWGTP
jgi:diguanylate cyclase (GGDEF)-like protein/PAS domain S-box-containing protein